MDQTSLPLPKKILCFYYICIARLSDNVVTYLSHIIPDVLPTGLSAYDAMLVGISVTEEHIKRI